MPKLTGISYSPQMIRAKRAGRKTQTRRLINPQPRELKGVFTWEHAHAKKKGKHEGAIIIDGSIDGLKQRLVNYCPYGRPGDQLWIKEQLENRGGRVHYTADGLDTTRTWGWKKNVLPAMYMGHSFCRSVDELTAVRVERLHEISNEDAIAEGCIVLKDEGEYLGGYTYCDDDEDGHGSPVSAYAHLWDSINPEPGCHWDENPWVWVLETRPIK